VLPAAAGVVLVAGALLPYLVLLAAGPRLARRLPLPERIDRGLARALGEREHWGHHERVDEAAVSMLVTVMVPAVALVVLGSWGMVETAISLSDEWGLSRNLVAVLVLAPLTSIPNAFTAARLGRAGRGSAVVSETLNSNTINLVAGVVVPALVVSVVALTTEVKFDLAWLVVMTVASLLLLSRPRGLRRADGLLLIGFYVVFCVVEIAQT
jgi:cation:H+ antiporter